MSDQTVDTALHTLIECPTWGEPKRDLLVTIGVGALSLGNMIVGHVAE